MIEPKRYEQLKIVRECWVKKCEIESLSEEEFLELSDLYETDAEFKAFCDADEELQAAVQWLVYFAGPVKRMRDYFYKFRDFCYGKSQRPDSPDGILSFYQIDSSFKARCDADPVVQAVIERWFKKEDPDPAVRAILEQWLRKHVGNASKSDIS